MTTQLTEHRKRVLIGVLLVLQLAILWVSLEWYQISPFCTVAQSSAWEWVGYVHALFIGLLLLGTASILWRRGGVWYVVLLCLGLGVLPLQAWLVEQRVLTCDGP